MKKVFLVLLVLSTGLICYGRGPARLKLASRNTYSVFEAPEDLNFSSFTLAWRSEAFLNGNYYGSIERKELVPSFGVEAGYTYHVIGPLEMEVAAFYSRYSTHYDAEMDAGSTRHLGIEAAMHFFVLPYIGAISHYVFPYVGAGYQTSALMNSNSSIPEADRYTMSVGTGGFFLEGGLKLFAFHGDDTNFFLFGSYKQTIPVSSDKLFRSMQVGLGLNF